VLAQAGLPSKAAETNVDKATSGLARPPARDLSLSLLVGGGGAVGWRWPVDDKQPAASWCSGLPVGGTGCSARLQSSFARTGNIGRLGVLFWI
jgi:hypothetical protein